jgi:uncharacterized protein
MNIAALRSVQADDITLQALANRRARLAERALLADAVAAQRAHLAARQACQQRITTALEQIEHTEHESETLTTKRARLEAQLKTVIAPREAEALMHEIATVTEARNALDDVELEAMEAHGAAEAEAAALDAGLPAIAAAVAAATSSLGEAEAAIDAESATVRARRDDVAGAVDADEMAWYESMARAHEGVGIALLEGSRCSGCHLDLSRGELDVVKAVPADEFAECPQCSRALAR